jgi:hypothetical protein
MEVLQMKQIIDIFMAAGEEISGLSFSTQMILLALYVTAFVLSILKTIEIYKDLIAMIREDSEKKKRWERVLQQAEKQVNDFQSNSAEDYQQQKIRFK